MTEPLDEDQLRAARFFEGYPKEAILDWFQHPEIGRGTLKILGRKLLQRDGRSADDSKA